MNRGIFYPDIYRTISVQRPGSFHPLALAGGSLYRSVRPTLRQLCRLPPTVTEIVNYIAEELRLHPGSGFSIFVYGIKDEGIATGSLYISLHPDKIIVTEINGTEVEVRELPNNKNSLFVVFEEFYREYPWLEINAVMKIFKRRLSCFRRDPYYYLIRSFQYLDDGFTNLIPYFSRTGILLKISLRSQLDTFASEVAEETGFQLPSYEEVAARIIAENPQLSSDQLTVSAIREILKIYAEFVSRL